MDQTFVETPPQGPPGPGTSFVLRPGDTSGAGNVYTSWAALMAVVKPGSQVIVDDTIQSPVHVTAGAWNVNGLKFIGVANVANEFAAVVVDQGATLSFGYTEWWNLEVQSNSTATVVTVAGLSILYTYFASINVNSQAVPFFTVASGGILVGQQSGGNWGDNVHALISVSTGGTFSYQGVNGADLEGHAVGGAGASAGASGAYTSDCNVHPSTQSGTFTMSSLASSTAYAPASNANWNNNPPATVAAALDRIAAKIGPIS